MSTTLQDTPRHAAAAGVRPNTPTKNPALHGPVLLATDGQSQSGAPVLAARSLATRLGLPLEVVAVLEPELMYGVALGGTPVYVPEMEEARRTNMLESVQKYIGRFSAGAPAPTVHLGFGGIADTIARVARERSATVIVVGAAPHQRVNRFIAGERAVHVLRSATVPVLSVPPGMTTAPLNIVVAIDFSPASVRAAQVALALLPDGGTLTLLHILPPLLGDSPLRDPAGRDPNDSVQTLFERIRDELRPYVPAGVTIETRIRTDYSSDGILAEAASSDADLIAVGTHGPRLLERIFVGSVAASVLHCAPQAVLAVPPPSAAEALELWRRISGTAVSTHSVDWAAVLDEFTRRNLGQRVTIEIDDPAIGAQVLARGSFAGVTYDSHDQRVEIMIGDASQARRHVMHSVPGVESVALTVNESPAREVLELRHGHGHTLVLIDQ